MTDETTQTPQAPEPQQAPPPPQQMAPPPQQMAPPSTDAVMSEAEINDGKIFGFVAYLGLIGFIVVLLTKKDNKFAIYHAKQSLVLIIVSIISSFIIWIPIIGWAVGIAELVLVIMGIVNALNGQAKPLPIIGKFADKFNF